MKLRYILYICVFLAVVLSCAKPPVEEMDSARGAVFRAENDADAVQYGSVSLARARDALRRMEDEANSKRYDTAKTYAAEAVSAAERAVSEGRTAAVRARDEAAALLSVLDREIDETSRNVSAARYSDLPLDFDSIDRDLMNAYTQADRAENDYDEGRYQDSIANAGNVRSNLSGINQQISEAVPRSKS